MLATVTSLSLATPALAGQYTDTPISNTDSHIVGWATSVTSLTRGPQDIAHPAGPLATWGASSDALGPAEGTPYAVVSLGDGGSITLNFATPIVNDDGPDFAVFENGFDAGYGTFAELAYVDVSSDDVHYYRFPSVSLTPTDEQIASFDAIDPTDIHNLAGQMPAGYGTPFDISELGPHPFLDIRQVRYVRITDVVGSITPEGAFTPSLDSLGNIINDPYPTPFATGGFDLDGIAVLHGNFIVPEPASFAPIVLAAAALSRRRRTVSRPR